MQGSEKQIKWALEIMAEYNRIIKNFGGESIECDDASFWINYGKNVNNINYKTLPTLWEAYSFLQSGNFVDNKSLRSQSMAGLISKDAALLIQNNTVTLPKKWN
jgi:hypothetical protein